MAFRTLEISNEAEIHIKLNDPPKMVHRLTNYGT